MFEESIKKAAKLLHQAEYAVALTGAGISTPSGIPDFRSEESGLWNDPHAQYIASIMGFRMDPEAFYKWIRPFTAKIVAAFPNPAHEALARLERLGRLKSVITQNIDMLHSRAGTQNVYELHGHLREATCLSCFTVYPTEGLIHEFLNNPSLKVLYCPKCNGILKPNVILFNEALPARALEAAERDARRCDVMLVTGSSLEVYPAADLPRRALNHGAKLILVNYEETPYDKYAEVTIHGDVADVLPRIAQLVEAGGE